MPLKIGFTAPLNTPTSGTTQRRNRNNYSVSNTSYSHCKISSVVFLGGYFKGCLIWRDNTSKDNFFQGVVATVPSRCTYYKEMTTIQRYTLCAVHRGLTLRYSRVLPASRVFRSSYIKWKSFYVFNSIYFYDIHLHLPMNKFHVFLENPKTTRDRRREVIPILVIFSSVTHLPKSLIPTTAPSPCMAKRVAEK